MDAGPILAVWCCNALSFVVDCGPALNAESVEGTPRLVVKETVGG